jgi:hypothetical protein
MDEGKAGVGAGEPETEKDPDRLAEKLDRRLELIRGHLGDLVSELDRRRHRAGKPLVIGVGVLAVVSLASVGGVMLWRRQHRRRRAVRQWIDALKRAVAHPDRVAPRKQEPSLPKKILAAAAASVASLLARRWAARLVAKPEAAGPAN